MKPQNRSIRDFFSTLPRSSQSPQTAPTPASTAAAHPATPGTENAPKQPLQPSTAPATLPLPPTYARSSTPTTTRAASPKVQPPPLSQTSVHAGPSKRVVSNGQPIVLDSDSDDESLPDLDWGEFNPITTNTTKPAVGRYQPLTFTENAADDLRRPSKKGKTGRMVSSLVVDTAVKNAEVERRIQQQKADLERWSEEPIVNKNEISEARLEQAVHDDDDPEKAHRLYLAMQRTNAIQTVRVYHFFDRASDSISVQSKFPVQSLPETQWAANFRDVVSRDQAFLTGFAHQVFCMQQLPEELASWMLDQFCYANNEVLLTRYLEILESHHEHLQSLLDEHKITVLFQSIGANVNSLDVVEELPLVTKVEGTRNQALSPGLKSIARLLRRAAPWLRRTARSHGLHILYFACLDHRVVADADTLHAVQDAMEALICRFADNKRLVAGVGSPPPAEEPTLMQLQLSHILPLLLSRVRDAHLQRKLVCALPARSPLTAYLQRYLALSFLLHPEVVDVPLSDPKIARMIHQCLNTAPSFRVNKHTNYGHLADLVMLLDIAIGPGLLSVPYQPLVSPAPSQGGSSPMDAPVPDSWEMKEFNKEIDALVQHVKMIGNSIVEAGAVVDLSILEAKDATERLCARLEHAVRLGGKKVHNPFAEKEEEQKQQPRLFKFFGRGKESFQQASHGVEGMP